MAKFPNLPHDVGDTVEMGDVTYKWTGDAWQVDVGEGGGSSEWTDTGTVLHPTESATDTVVIGATIGDTNAKLTVDGTQSLKTQSAIPTETEGYAHLYAKDVDVITPTNVLLNLDNSGEDGVDGNPSIVYPGPHDPVFDDSTGNFKFGTHSLKFLADDGSNGGAFAIIPFSANLDVGQNDFVIDFWLKIASGSGGTGGTWSTVGGTIIGIDTSDGTYGADTTLSNRMLRLGYVPHAETDGGKWFIYGATGSDGTGVVAATSNSAPKTQSELQSWNHIALVRTGTALKVFIGGSEVVSVVSGSGGTPGNIFGINDPGLVFGGRRVTQNDGYSSNGEKGLDCWYDSIRVANGTNRGWSNGFTPPTAAETIGSTTHLFAQDGASSERDLTPTICAFKAYDSSGGSVTITGDIYPGDTTVFNLGGNYSTSSYKFTAPLTGLYQFSWNSHSANPTDTSRRMMLMVEDTAVLRTGDTGNSSNFTTIVTLNKDDEAWLATYSSYPINYKADLQYNEFSGHYIGPIS